MIVDEVDVKKRIRSTAPRLACVLMYVITVLSLSAFSGCDFAEMLTKKQETAPPRKVFRVDVMNPATRVVTDYKEFTGETAAIDEVDIRAQVTGYLSKVTFIEGAQVRKGDLLFEIEPEVYQAIRDSAAAELGSLKATLPRLENEVTRNGELVTSRAVSEADYEIAVADRDECLARIEKAKAELQHAEINLKYTRIYSPVDGFISRKLVTEGNLIQPHSSSNSTLMARVVSLHPIYVAFNVDESTFLELAQTAEEKFKSDRTSATREQTIEFRLTNEDSFVDGQGKPFHTGVVKYSDPYMDKASGTVLLRATCDNPSRSDGKPFLLPGFMVHVRIPVTANYQALVIPEEAVATDQGLSYVYVIDKSKKAQMRYLKLGPLQPDNMRVIRDGLKPGDTIAVTGLMYLRPDLEVEAIPTTLETLRENTNM